MSPEIRADMEGVQIILAPACLLPGIERRSAKSSGNEAECQLSLLPVSRTVVADNYSGDFPAICRNAGIAIALQCIGTCRNLFQCLFDFFVSFWQ